MSADVNFAGMGEAFIQTGFAGSYEFMGIAIFLIFAFFLWKARAGLGTTLVFGLGITYTIWLMGVEVFGTIFWMGVIAVGVYLGLAILNFARR